MEWGDARRERSGLEVVPAAVMVRGAAKTEVAKKKRKKVQG